VLAAGGNSHLDEVVRGLDAGVDKLGPVVTLQLYAIELELQRGRYDAALARLDTIAAQSVRQETWLARRGEILERAGRADSARATYATALTTLDTLPPSARRVGAMTELRTRVCAALTRLGSPSAETHRDCGEQVSGA